MNQKNANVPEMMAQEEAYGPSLSEEEDTRNALLRVQRQLQMPNDPATERLLRLHAERLLAIGAKKDPATDRLWRSLKRKLLAIGGKLVSWLGCEPHLKELVDRGRLFEEPIRIRRMEQHRCHANAANLWVRDMESTVLVTGYSLSNDHWVQHSWALKKGRLLETTWKREKYFGIALDEVEALKCWVADYADPMNLSVEVIYRDFPQVLPVFAKARED
jgi:hypothetical protein